MSFISPSLGALFIHVPKAAGSSLASVSWNGGSGHDTLADFDARGEIEPGLRVWAFVRHPFDRIACAYEDCPELFDACPTFDSFVETIWNNRGDLDGMKAARWGGGYRLGLPVGRIHFLPQHLLLRDLEGEMRADFVGRFENLQAEFNRLSKWLGVAPETLLHKNTRKGKQRRRFTPLSELYQSEETRRRVADLYAIDFATFNYSPKYFIRPTT